MMKPGHGGQDLPAVGPLLLVTRPAAQAHDWVGRLQARGLRAQALPLLSIAPAPQVDELVQMAAALRPGALVVFVSPNAVEHAFAALAGSPGGPLSRWPEGVRAAAVGPGTVAALRVAGVPQALIVAPAADRQQFDSEALWALLCEQDWRGRDVWVVRGEGGRDWLADQLKAAGARTHAVQGYRRGAPVLDAAGQALLAQALGSPAGVRWLFSSSEAIGHLDALAPGHDWSRATAWVSHPRIAERARQLGVGSVRLIAPGVDGVAAAVAAEGVDTIGPQP